MAACMALRASIGALTVRQLSACAAASCAAFADDAALAVRRRHKCPLPAGSVGLRPVTPVPCGEPTPAPSATPGSCPTSFEASPPLDRGQRQAPRTMGYVSRAPKLWEGWACRFALGDSGLFEPLGPQPASGHPVEGLVAL